MIRTILAALSAVAAGFAVGGCASTPTAAPSEFAWSYADSPGEGAKLAFGRPNSDEVVLMMVCAPGQTEVALSAAGLNTARLMLASGAARTSLNGVVTDGIDPGSGLIEASLPVRAPALAGFRQSDGLVLTSSGRALDLTASAADRPAVRRFFDACHA